MNVASFVVSCYDSCVESSQASRGAPLNSAVSRLSRHPYSALYVWYSSASMRTNTVSFVTDLLPTLATAHVRSWLCGGWAEEVWGVIAPRSHTAVDRLYPAAHFVALDQLIMPTTSMTESRAKRFSHTRAVMYHDVMVEWLLIASCASRYVTNFFDGRPTFYWSPELLTQVRGPASQLIDVASRDALAVYRLQFEARVQAYQAYLAHQASR